MIILGAFLVALFVLGGSAEAQRNTVEVSFYFNEGWSLVAGFYSPEQLSGGVVKSSDIRAIYAFVPQTQQYARIYPNPEKDKLKVMGDYDDQLGYMAQWVYSTEEGRAEYMIEREEIPLNQWELQSGWNFIGVVFPEMIGKRLHELKGDCQFSKVYSYVFGRGAAGWKEIKKEKDDRVDEESIGLGFIAKVPVACKLGVVLNAPPPPALP